MERFKRTSPRLPSSKGSNASSAVERITSGKNMKNSVLPEFMRASNARPKTGAIYQAPERSRSPMFTSFERARSTSPDIEAAGGFIQSIFIPDADLSEIMIRVRQRDIYREDLRSFAARGMLTRSIIDASLSIIKQLNHDFLVKDEANDKVIISSTEFSQGIFCTTRNNTFHAPTYVMKYE